MSGVDSRIVTMKFDNQQFEQGVNTSIGSMKALTESMNSADGSKGLTGLADGASKVSAGFIAMSTIAITALSNITNKAVDAGLQLAKSLTIEPITAGFAEYELKMGAIQTIMAGSGESLDVVNQKLQELNTYSDKTIYSFKDMTSNIGKFTNAGVSLDDSVAAIQGVANVAALSGANAEEASRAMYNFAQSISSGSVKLMDWKSIELANMATVEFKTELMESAVAAGTLNKSADGMYTTLKGTPISATKGFNESLSEQWMTAESLTTTLGRYSDATTDIGARATAAATEVKTFSQLMDTLKEGAGSGWATTSEIVIGNFEEAKQLWTGINTSIGGMIGASADARNAMLTEWKTLGGRDVLLEGLTNAAKALGGVLKPIKDAFREIFPAQTGKDLYRLTVFFKQFTEKLQVGSETAENLKRTFKGVFAVFSIVWQVVKGVLGVFGQLFGALTEGDGGFLRFTGTIGDFLVKIDSALKKGDLLKNFFKALGAILSAPISAIKMLGGFIADLFGGFDNGAADNMGNALGNISDRFKEFTESIQEGLGSLGNVLKKVGNFLAPIIEGIADAFSSLWEAIAEVFKGGDPSLIFSALNTGIFAMIGIAIKKFLSGGLFGQSGVTGMFESITGVFNGLTDTLKSMQQKVKAEIILKIAIAVGILALSLIGLAMVDPEKLAGAVGAITVMFGELLGAMAILEKIGTSKGMAKVGIISAGMILLSTAILILSAAVKNLAELSWSELTRGLLGVAALMAILVVAVKPLAANAGGMIKAGAGILVLSIALKVLASVVKTFAEMSWSEIGQGLLSMTGALIAIAGAIRLMPKNMALTAVSILVLSVSLKVLASVVKTFAEMSWSDIGQGLVSMAGALIIIAGAMRLMPKNMALTAVGLLLVSVALKVLASALQDMGSMSWEEVGRGLVVLAGSLVILSAGLYLMSGTLAGSAALLVAALALAVFVPVLKALGSMDWGNIIKGLVAIAGLFVILGAAGYLLAPVVPIIALLALSIAAIGIAMLAAGVGVLAFATALTILAALGTAAAAVIITILGAIISQIPVFMAAVAQGIIDFAKTLGDGAADIAQAMGLIISAVVDKIIEKTPEVIAAFVAMVTGFLDGVIELMPKFAETAKTIIETMLDVLTFAIPQYVEAGIKILTGILTGIGNNIYRVITAATKIITEFIRALGDNAPKVADEGAKTIIKFIDGITAAINNNQEELRRAGKDLAKAIINGMVAGLADGINIVKNKAKEVAQAALDAAKGLLGINSPSKAFMDIGRNVDEGFAGGVDAYSNIVNKSVLSMGNEALNTMKTTMSTMADVLERNIDVEPVITPVLDLSQVQKEASRIKNLMAADVSANQAGLISDNQREKQAEKFNTVPATPATLINFEQHNSSPKALSTVEIYRQTKNQLSLAKEALNA